MPKRQKLQAWWISDVTEICPACHQLYAYHTEIRCVDCDSPVCPICVQVTTVEAFCPECFKASTIMSEEPS